MSSYRLIVRVALILAVVPPGVAHTFLFTNCCGDNEWATTCNGASCGPNRLLRSNNWGRSACGAYPTFPSTADSVEIGAQTIGVSGAQAGDLHVGSGGILNVGRPSRNTLFYVSRLVSDGELNLY